MKAFLLILCTYFFLFLFSPSAISEANEKNNTVSTINSYEEDITGDGFREDINLKGELLREKSNFYRDVWIDITSPFSHQWKILLESGYEPSIQFIDLNHDHTLDLLYQVAKDEDKPQYIYQLYTIDKNVVKQIPVPSHNHIRTKFLNDFQVEIQINPTLKPIIQDISNNKDLYLKEQIYDENGKLLNDKKIKPSNIRYLKPVVISKTKGYGLKSYQPIKGANEKDVLGEIETYWYYHQNKWIILKTEWVGK